MSSTPSPMNENTFATANIRNAAKLHAEGALAVKSPRPFRIPSFPEELRRDSPNVFPSRSPTPSMFAKTELSNGASPPANLNPIKTRGAKMAGKAKGDGMSTPLRPRPVNVAFTR